MKKQGKMTYVHKFGGIELALHYAMPLIERIIHLCINTHIKCLFS